MDLAFVVIVMAIMSFLVHSVYKIFSAYQEMSAIEELEN